MKVKLTKTVIDKATYRGEQYPGGGWPKCVLWDASLAGFGVRIFPSGVKTFILKYRSGNRSRVMTLGDFGPLTLQDAEAKAREELGRITLDGRDPLDERERKRDAATMADLCKEYLERHAKVHKRSWKKDESRINRLILPKWKTRQVVSITRSEVAEFHKKIGEGAEKKNDEGNGKKKAKKKGDGGRYEANRVLELLRKMFNLAMDWGYLDENATNPARRIERFKEEKRDRWVTPVELPEVAKAIDAEENVYIRAALWLYLLTGVRRNELLQAKWTDLDHEQKQLRIPPENSKAGQVQYVPLSPEALAIFKEIPAMKGNPFVFPSTMKEGRHLVNIDRAWRRVRRIAQVDEKSPNGVVRLHDLRRTFGSWLATSGNSLLLIQKALRHATPAATQVYARLGQDPVREAVDSLGKRLMTAAGRRKTAEVIDFEEAAKAR